MAEPGPLLDVARPARPPERLRTCRPGLAEAAACLLLIGAYGIASAHLNLLRQNVLVGHFHAELKKCARLGKGSIAEAGDAVSSYAAVVSVLGS
jgi:hypothetical protein